MYEIRVRDPRTSLRTTIHDLLMTVARGQFTIRDLFLIEKRKYLTLAYKGVQLVTAKEYCGNHPGPCQVGFFGERPKKRMRYLEADDWILFNNMVNDTLDVLRPEWSHVSSSPQGQNGRLLIRHPELGRRKRWDYYDSTSYKAGSTYYRPHYEWLAKADDQFTAGDGYEGEEVARPWAPIDKLKVAPAKVVEAGHCYRGPLCRNMNPCACRCGPCSEMPMHRYESDRVAGVAANPERNDSAGHN